MEDIKEYLIDNIKANAVKNWVPQGWILDPLFLLFNIDLPKAAKDTTTALCADDTSVVVTNPSTKIISNILLSRLIPYAEEIIGVYQCGFQCNTSTTDHIFCMHQILEKKWEYNEAVHQLFIDLKKAYDLDRREVLYNNLIEYGMPMKLVRQMKMCLNETYGRVRVGKNLSDIFPIRNGLKQGDAFITIAFHLCFRICH